MILNIGLQRTHWIGKLRQPTSLNFYFFNQNWKQDFQGPELALRCVVFRNTWTPNALSASEFVTLHIWSPNSLLLPNTELLRMAVIGKSTGSSILFPRPKSHPTHSRRLICPALAYLSGKDGLFRCRFKISYLRGALFFLNLPKRMGYTHKIISKLYSCQ